MLATLLLTGVLDAGEGPGPDPEPSNRGRITLAEAKRQLRLEVDDTERDDEIAGFIADAEAWVERYTGHIIAPRNVSQQFDAIGQLRLRAWPIKPDAVPTVVYVADDGSDVTVAGARLSLGDRPWRALAAHNTNWPWSVGSEITVTVRAGYEDGDEIPGNLRRAMLVLIAAYDLDREGGDAFEKAEKTARALAGSERLWSV